jgi:hypothetical protein
MLQFDERMSGGGLERRYRQAVPPASTSQAIQAAGSGMICPWGRGTLTQPVPASPGEISWAEPAYKLSQ